jgi:hypothetical protein
VELELAHERGIDRAGEHQHPHQGSTRPQDRNAHGLIEEVAAVGRGLDPQALGRPAFAERQPDERTLAERDAEGMGRIRGGGEYPAGVGQENPIGAALGSEFVDLIQEIPAVGGPQGRFDAPDVRRLEREDLGGPAQLLAPAGQGVGHRGPGGGEGAGDRGVGGVAGAVAGHEQRRSEHSHDHDGRAQEDLGAETESNSACPRPGTAGRIC